ncbi:hypothetical protein NSTC745_06441 [Nostoc sp. DSM 114161]|jgi:hypothetical protein|uniref:Rad52/Rad22 family DNA repair protein n=1 Tax=Nostoc sp. DSM 114161 TaxID=3440143 RepID=UPI0040459524
MITPEVRDELRRIQSELKKLFPADLHEVRELPGSNKKWVFLRWQTIRERLDEVAPDWMSDYSEIQYMGNDAICRCGITILGVRKEAIASVPISLQSSKGNEMTRGSAADRLAAEGLKNAAESWGVGRYLDDQPSVVRYLWENRVQLSDQMEQEVRRLAEQYKTHAMTHVSSPKKPSSAPTTAVAPLSPPPVDRNLLNAEIESLLKRKNISVKQAQNALFELFKVRSRQHLNDKQLQEFLEYLRSSPVAAN